MKCYFRPKRDRLFSVPVSEPGWSLLPGVDEVPGPVVLGGLRFCLRCFFNTGWFGFWLFLGREFFLFRLLFFSLLSDFSALARDTHHLFLCAFRSGTSEYEEQAKDRQVTTQMAHECTGNKNGKACGGMD